MKIWTIALRNIGRNRRRSLLSGLAIAVAAMAFLMLSALLEGISEDMAYNIQTYYSGEIRIRNREYDRNEQLMPLHLGIDDYREVLAVVEKELPSAVLAPRITFPGAVYLDDTSFRVSAVGLDIEREKAYMNLESILSEGRIPDPETREILIGEGLAGDMGVAVGDRITVMTKTRSRGINAFTFAVSGLVRPPVTGLSNTIMLVPLSQARRFLKMDDSVTEILVKSGSTVDPEEAAGDINEALKRSGIQSIQATPWTRIRSSYSFIQMAESAYLILAVVLFLLGSTVIVNTTMMVVYERVREIGTVSAMGMYSSEIVMLFFSEAFFISLLGTIGGIVIGIGLTVPMSIYGLDFSGAFQGLSLEMSPVFYPVLRLSDIFIVMGYSVGIASLASIVPSMKASRVQPVEALRSI